MGIQPDLPEELWAQAIDLLDAKSRLTLRKVSKKMKDLADDHLGWKHLFQRKIDISLFEDTEDHHWKSRYLLLEKTPFSKLLIVQRAGNSNLQGDDQMFNEMVARQKMDPDTYVAFFKDLGIHRIFEKISTMPEFYKFRFFCIDTKTGLGTSFKGPVAEDTTIRFGGFFFQYRDRNFVIRAFNRAASVKEKASSDTQESELA